MVTVAKNASVKKHKLFTVAGNTSVRNPDVVFNADAGNAITQYLVEAHANLLGHRGYQAGSPVVADPGPPDKAQWPGGPLRGRRDGPRPLPPPSGRRAACPRGGSRVAWDTSEAPCKHSD